MLARAIKRLRTGGRPPRRDAGLETCVVCAGDFVNPVEWQPAGETHWWMLLRCGGCGTWREVTVPNAVAARFDGELDRRLHVLTRAVERLDRKHMTADVETMTEALRRDLVDAGDFAR